MLLAVDIGNSNVSFALFDFNCSSDPLIVSSQISTQKNRTADEYAVLIKQILDLKIGSNYTISHSAISSVVPSATSTVSSAVKILSDCNPYIIRPGIKTGFRISINDPACLGSDIVSNVSAALDVCDTPAVIFDAGTANTITVVDESRTVVGTVILPGIRISATALAENAELLDPIHLSNTDLPLIGKSTDQSIRSGLIHGSSLMLDAYVRNIRESLIGKDSDKKLGLIATGEFGKLITDNCRNKFIFDQNLTLRGIASLYYRNAKSS